MPRIRRGENGRTRHPQLVAELVAELRRDRPTGQPRIEEQCLRATDLYRITVFWDKWDDIADEERWSTILDAYEQVEGPTFRDRIALATGLTYPEAYESGLLPFSIIAAVRAGDRVTWDECKRLMIGEGASLLFDADRPQLRFATLEEAEACLDRLVQQIPESQAIWQVSQEVARVP